MPQIRFQSRSPIGLDIGARAIKAVQLSEGPHGCRIEAVAIIPRALQSTGDIAPGELAQLDRILARKGFTSRDLVIAVPAGKLLSASLELPPINGIVAMEPIVRNEFCRSQKVEAADVEIAHWEIPAPARAARGTHVMAAGCRRLDAESLVYAFSAMDWQVIALDVSAVATARACAAATSLVGLTAILDIGWSGAKLLMLHEQTILFDRILADVGIRTLLTNIVAQTHLPEELVELLLHRPSALHPSSDDANSHDVDLYEPKLPARAVAEVRNCIRDHFNLIGTEVQASMSYATQRYPDTSSQQLLVLGGGASAADAVEQLQQIIGVECRIVTPLMGAIAKETLAAQCTSVLTPAAGLARFAENSR